MSANNIPIKYKGEKDRRRMKLLASLIARKKSYAMSSFTTEERDDVRWMWQNNILEARATPKGIRYSVTEFGHQVRARADEIYAEEGQAA